MRANKLPLHVWINQVFIAHGPGPETDAALAKCKDAECRQCSFIICPDGDPMHFHHDGCPTCAQVGVCRFCGMTGVGFADAEAPSDYCGHDPALVRRRVPSTTPCSSCGGSGCQGNGPGVGGCTDCLGTGKEPL